MDAKNISVKDFTYYLPEEKIALYPLEDRGSSRLLVYDNASISERKFDDILDFFLPGDVLVVNKTRVINARLFFKTPQGATIEIFCIGPSDSEMTIEKALNLRGKAEWLCLVGRFSKWKTLEPLQISLGANGPDITATFSGKVDDLFKITFEWNPPETTFSEVIEHVGKIPLPPYLKRAIDEEDYNRYQTVYGCESGSVAAPTAGLHFSESLMQKLRNKGVQTSYITLHVGAGTFRPVKANNMGAHEMHKEEIIVSAETIRQISEAKGRIISLGTTTLRCLESIYLMALKVFRGQSDDLRLHTAQWDGFVPDGTEYPDVKVLFNHLHQVMGNRRIQFLQGETKILIAPGFKIRTCDYLITNFHQPGSTLLLLVAACIGDQWKKVYQYALDNDFRFLSYGDASLLRIEK